MNIDSRRRSFIRLGAALPLAGAFAPAWSLAQDAYPSAPIRIIVGVGAGSGTDGIARSLASLLTPLLKQTVFVENKTGAHGLIAGSMMKSAEKNGYTLLIGSGGTMAINPPLYGDKLPYDPVKDFTPIAPLGRGTFFLAVNSNSPIRTLKDLIEYVRAKGPGNVNIGTGGIGSTAHLAMALLQQETGMKLAHIPYQTSAAAMQDLVGGQVDVTFEAGAPTLPLVRAGRIRVIGVASKTRSASLPDVPTISEQGVPDFETLAWTGLFAPAGTPESVVQILNKAVSQAVRSPDFERIAKAQADEVAYGSSEDLRKFLASQIELWTRAVKLSGAKAEI